MIIVMGSVGSGKSEQTSRLAARLRLPRISTSNLLRLNLTPEREAKMMAGELINDQEMISILDSVLKKIVAPDQDFLLDGFPRSIPQAEWLVQKIKDGNIKLKAIIKLDVSDEIVLKRMLNRGRADDKKEVILRRLKAYHQTTIPVVDYFRSQGITVNEINGEQAPDVVEAQIEKVLNSKND